MTLNRIIPSLFLIVTLTGMAQDADNDAPDHNPYFSLTFGLNMIDNSNNKLLPFDGNQLNVNTPFFLTAEHRIHKNWSMALTLSTNQLKLDNPAVTAPYFSADIFANLFVDQFIFNNENIDLFVGFGAGIHTLQGNAAASFNGTGGFRYWVSERMAINLQAIGKINRDGLEQLDNHYQFNVGVTYTFKQKEQPKTVVPVETMVKATDSTQVATVPRVYKEPAEFSLEEEKEVKKTVTVTSTDLAKNVDEADQIKKNAATSLNQKSSNTRPAGVNKGYHVIVYAFEYKNNLDKMVRLLTDSGIKVQVIRVAAKNLDYISVAYFKTSAEAHNYMNNTLNKNLFKDSWVYEVD